MWKINLCFRLFQNCSRIFKKFRQGLVKIFPRILRTIKIYLKQHSICVRDPATCTLRVCLLFLQSKWLSVIPTLYRCLSIARNEILQKIVAIIIREDRRITVRELAQHLNILIGNAFAILQNDLQMWCVMRVGITFAYTRTNGTLRCCMQRVTHAVSGRGTGWIL